MADNVCIEGFPLEKHKQISVAEHLRFHCFVIFDSTGLQVWGGGDKGIGVAINSGPPDKISPYPPPPIV